MRKILVLTWVAFTFSIHFSIGQIAGDQLFDNSIIHEVEIVSFYPGLTDTLASNYIMSFGMGQIQVREIPYSQALLIIDGTTLDTLGVRYKGFNSWWSSIKKPIKIDINKYKKDQKYDGLSKFNLHNGAGDPSFLRENICYEILRSLGIKAPRTSYAKVFVDTAYQGLFRIVEQVDNTFLDINFGNHNGNLYAQQGIGSSGYSFDWRGNNQEAYYESIALENHRNINDWSGFIHFLDVLNNTPENAFRDSILSVFDVDEYLQILAFEIAVNNIDWYGDAGRNYYLVEVDGKIHWIPWDYNLTWREDAKPVNINPKDFPVLINRILQVPEFYDQFMQKYCSLKLYFSESYINSLIDNEFAAISSYIQNDPYSDFTYEAFETNMQSSWNRIPGLKEFAAQRYNDISRTLESLGVECAVGIETPSVNQNELQLYPVPASNSLTIGIFPNCEVEVSVFNSCGQLVMKSKVFEKGTFNISELSAGCYLVKANIGEKMYSKLLIVKP